MKKLSHTPILLLSLFISTFQAFACTTGKNKNQVLQSGVSDLKAVSVNNLQTSLRQGKQSKGFKTFFGIRRIEGFVVDPESKDVIFYGSTEGPTQPLRLDDLVVALRNEKQMYAKKKGYTTYYEYPGCSIDPVPSTMLALNKVKKRLQASSSMQTTNKHIRKWNKICKQPQNVRVEGLPFHSHFAHVLVKADYDMKLLADGSDDLGIPGFLGVSKITMAEIEHRVKNNQPMPPMSMTNRFWFYPGKIKMERHKGSYLILQCQVKLLTEAMHTSQSGELQRGYTCDPIADQFTNGFTAVYDKIAQKRPIYYELENMFRLFAIAKVLAKQNTANLNYFLHQHIVKPFKVHKNVPGHAALQKLDINTGVGTRIIRSPSCGGVTIRMEEPGKYVKHRRRSRSLNTIRNDILSSRPSKSAVTWNIKNPRTGRLIRRRQANYGLNTISSAIAVIDIAYKDGNFVVANGNRHLLTSKNHDKIFETIRREMERDQKEVGYLNLKEFTKEKADAFRLTLDIQKGEAGLDTPGRLVPVASEPTVSADSKIKVLLSPGLTRAKQNSDKVTQVKQGSNMGKFRAVQNLYTNFNAKLYKISLIAITRTSQLAKGFISVVKNRMGAHNAYNGTSADLVQEVRKELARKYKATEKDVQLWFKEECKGSCAVDFGMPAHNGTM